MNLESDLFSVLQKITPGAAPIPRGFDPVPIMLLLREYLRPVLGVSVIFNVIPSLILYQHNHTNTIRTLHGLLNRNRWCCSQLNTTKTGNQRRYCENRPHVASAKEHR